jgi:hypothetical protein
MYTELQAINACLASMGEAPVLDLTVPHPYVPQAISFLAKHNKLVQTNRWWFNSVTATITESGGVYTASLPAGTLSIEGKNGKAYVLLDDGTVYDHTLDEAATGELEVYVVKEKAFAMLPPEANAYVADCAILDFQVSFDSDSNRTQMLRENRARSWAMLQAQNARMMKTNMFKRVAAKLNDMRGDRPLLRGQE